MDYRILVDNCTTKVYLGTANSKNLKEISKSLGTVHTGPSTRDTQPLIDPGKILTMPVDECIIKVQGQKPFLDEKYKTAEHPNFKECGYSISENRFNVGRCFRSPDVVNEENNVNLP